MPPVPPVPPVPMSMKIDLLVKNPFHECRSTKAEEFFIT